MRRCVTIFLLSLVTLIPPTAAEIATLTADTVLQLKSGTISLDKGTVVEVLSTETDAAVVAYRNLRGKIPLSALDHIPAAPPALPTPESILPPARIAPESFRVDVAAASQTLAPALQRAEALVVDGRFEDGNQALLDTLTELDFSPQPAEPQPSEPYEALPYALHLRSRAA